jgi:hypothetical protein
MPQETASQTETRTMRFLRPAALLALALAAPTVAADDVTTTGGKKITGKLVAVDAQGITFSTGDAKVTIPARDIVLVDFGNKPAPLAKDATFSEVELTDGSVFRVAKFALKGKKLTTELLPGPAGVPAPRYELPMAAVFAAVKRADDPKTKDAWKKMLAGRGKRDMYVMAQESGLTYQQGTILGGGDDGVMVNFESEGGGKAIELRQSRAAGLVFYQPQLATVPPTVCRVADVFGNTLTAAAVAISADGVVVTTVSGAVVTYPSAAALARFDYESGNLAYLSDLTPQVDGPKDAPEDAKLEPKPADRYWKDTTLANGPIKLEGATYAKGLCVLPDTALTYNLNGDYTQFRATAGIDENGLNAAPAARLIVEADGQVVFNEVLRRKDKPKGVTLTVKGVKQLRLIVEVDTPPVNGDYVTLAEARVQK